MKLKFDTTQNMKRSRSFPIFIPIACLLAGLIFSQSAVNAQEKPETATPSAKQSSGAAAVLFDVDIENGLLMVAPLKKHVDVKALWGEGAVQSVPATVHNILKYLRGADRDLNVIAGPEAGEVEIKELKLRSADIASLMESLGYATGGAIRAVSFGSGTKSWILMASRTTQPVERTVEVFNVSGFIRHLTDKAPKPEEQEQIVHQGLNQVKEIIEHTFVGLIRGKRGASEAPEYQFHAGTSLLVVTGSPQAIDVARKVVNALPGQTRINMAEPAGRRQ
jgi:hypothetical protein